MRDGDILRQIGQLVRVRRLELELTQECLAELVGIHWQTISAIERGTYPVSLLTFARLCQHLEVSPERILEGIPAPDKKRAERVKRALARKRRVVKGGE